MQDWSIASCKFALLHYDIFIALLTVIFFRDIMNNEKAQNDCTERVS